MRHHLNAEIAGRLRFMADLREQQGDNGFRVQAYRRAADTLEALEEPVDAILAHKGRAGLIALEGVGAGIAAAIAEIVATGRWAQLERLQGLLEPEKLFRSLPGIGPKLAARQRPGAGNALGRVRFDMPNPFAIYLHDTSGRNLFERSERTLSHGCIRVDDPVGLAADLLANTQWTRDALQAEINTGATQAIRLDAPLPIFILYITAAADADGVVYYADDVYARDRPLLQQLEHAPARTLAAHDVGPVRCAG